MLVCVCNLRCHWAIFRLSWNSVRCRHSMDSDDRMHSTTWQQFVSRSFSQSDWFCNEEQRERERGFEIVWKICGYHWFHSFILTMIPAIFSGMEFAVQKSHRPSTNRWSWLLLLLLSMLLSSEPISNIAPYPHCHASRPPFDCARTFLQKIDRAHNKEKMKWFEKKW